MAQLTKEELLRREQLIEKGKIREAYKNLTPEQRKQLKRFVRKVLRATWRFIKKIL